MGVVALAKQLGLEKPWEKLDKASIQELATDLATLSASFLVVDWVKSIREQKITGEDIDYFLKPSFHGTPAQKAALLSMKACLLTRPYHAEEWLGWYDEALRTWETPSTWALKGTALLQLERLDEAFQAFQQAYLLRENFGPQKQGYLEDLFKGWSTAALLRGLFGILEQDSRELQKGVDEYLGVLDKARVEKLEDAATVHLKAEDPASVELQEVIEEWELAVRLLSIKDPFEGWWALSKEISKVWPKGVSAVKAVREMRR
jgi:tetratricopeptide (TPR) repeat protein